MKKIVLYVATSLDWYIAKRNGSVDFLDSYNETGEDYGYNDFINTIDVVIMGNTTYKQFGNNKEFKQYYKGKKVYVFSKKTSQKSVDVTFVSGNVKEFIDRLKITSGKNIWLVGGSLLTHEFTKHKLVDEYIITIIPILLGDGISLFRKGFPEQKLDLIDVKSYDRGVIQVHYLGKSKK